MGLTPSEELELKNLRAQGPESNLSPAEEAELAFLKSGMSGEVINEMPPEMQNLKGKLTRTLYKNFGNPNQLVPDPNAKLYPPEFSKKPYVANNALNGSIPEVKRYLNQLTNYRQDVPAKASQTALNTMASRHPDVKFTQDPQTQDILAQSKASGKNYRLDPEGFDWQDIPDSAWDTLTGLGIGSAAGTAGLATTAATLLPTGPLAPALGLGAASATSGALGYGTDVARQAIGKQLGMTDEIDQGNALAAGAFNAVIPGLMGGAGSKQALSYAANLIKSGKMPVGTTVEELAKRLGKTQDGLLQKGYGAFTTHIAPVLGELASGISSKTINTAKKIMPQIRAFEKDPHILLDKADAARTAIVDSIHTEDKVVGQQIGGLLKEMDDTAGKAISTRDILAPIKELKKSLAEGGDLSNHDKELLQALNDTVNHNFAVDSRATIPHPQAGKWVGGPTGKMVPDEATINVGGFVVPEFVTASKAQKFKHALNDIARSKGLRIEAADTAEGALGGVKQVETSRVAGTFGAAAAAAKDGISTLANKLSAFRLKSSLPTPAGPKNGTSYLGRDFSKDYTRLNARFGSLKDAAHELQLPTSSEDAILKLAQKYKANDARSRATVDLATELSGRDIPKLADEIMAIKTFSNPSTEILPNKSPTSRIISNSLLSSLAGYALAKATGFNPHLGSLIGLGVGSKVGSPWAMRKAIEAGNVVRGAGDFMTNLPYPQMIEKNLPKLVPRPGDVIKSSPYMMMQSYGNER